MKRIILIFFEFLVGIFMFVAGSFCLADRSLHYSIMSRYSYPVFDGLLFFAIGILFGIIALMQLTGILKQRKSNQSKKIDYS